MKKQFLTFAVCIGVLAAGGRAAAQSDYMLGAADVVTISVYGEPDLSNKFTIEADGTFTFPMIGRVKAGGMTLRQVEQDIKLRLSDGYLRSPQVTVTIGEYKSQQVLVLGEVRNPGPYQLTGGMTLLQAIAQAGSTTTAAANEALIVRPSRRSATPGAGATTGAGEQSEEPDAEIIRIDLTALQAGDLSLNVALRDGDTVQVPKAQSAFVTGEVKSPGGYPVDRNMTVLQMLSLAGGLTDRGSDSRIRIQRIVKGTRIEIRAKLTDIVQPGDTIVVPQRFF